MPAKSASLPRFSGCESTATAPHCASASTIFTPGMIGLPGKCPAQSSSVTVLRATTRSPGTSSSTSSISSNGSRCGRTASIAALSDRHARRSVRDSRSRRPFARRGARSTSPCRRAAPWPREISSNGTSKPSFSATTVACAGGSSARQRPSSRRVSERCERGPGRRPRRPAGPRRAARCGARGPARLRDVLARVHDEPVEPRRELRLAAELPDAPHELHERLLRRVARVVGVAEHVQRDPLDARRVPGAERLERLRSPSFARRTRIGSESRS